MTLKEFFCSQVALWPLAKQNYEALDKVETRDIESEDGDFVRLQFNPARVISTKANIDPKALKARPCFFCHEHRPKEQFTRPELIPENWRGKFELLVNPYPILPMHFTLPLVGHKPQELLPYIGFMFDFVELHPAMCCFYNGPLSGASAPDHMHFQSVPKDLVPLYQEHNIPNSKSVFRGTKAQCVEWYKKYHREFPCPCGEKEPMSNVFVAKEDGSRFSIVIFLRNKHRPSCYPDKRLVSPGALDMAGVLITPRREDFEGITIQEAKDIYEDVASSSCQHWMDYSDCAAAGHDAAGNIFIKVGLVSDCEHDEDYYINVKEMEQSGYRRYDIHNDTLFVPQSSDSTFAVRNMPIGIDFHWRQNRDLRFKGALQIMRPKDGATHYVNIIPLEEYLKCVVSSEMSAMSNIELLKAHAIISRSWVMAQIKDPKDFKDPNVRPKPHALFDVCADDHCQRYQGVTMQTTRLAEEAVEATRGQLLKYNGEICDTRYSKCCGGKSEEFEYCWEDKHYDYLESVDCPYCNTREQFDAEEEKRVLSQVLNDYDLKTRDFYEWQVKLSAEQLKDLLRRKIGLDLGDILDLQPVARGKSGRIWQLRIVGTEGERTIGKELLIRKALSETHLYSSNFTVEALTAPPCPAAAEPTVPRASVAGPLPPSAFLLKGKGWGHGVGLCQIGAAVMAEKGFTYKQILNHYFPKATIEHY